MTGPFSPMNCAWTCIALWTLRILKKWWDALRNTVFKDCPGHGSGWRLHTTCAKKLSASSFTDVTVEGQQNIGVNILARGQVDLGLWIPILHQPGGRLFGISCSDIRQTCFRFRGNDIAGIDSSLCHSDMRGMIEMWDVKTLYLIVLIQSPQQATVQELNAMLAAKPGESLDRIWYYLVLKISSPDHVVHSFSPSTEMEPLCGVSSIPKEGGERGEIGTFESILLLHVWGYACNSSPLTSERAVDASRNMQKFGWSPVVFLIGLQQLLLRPANRTSLQARHLRHSRHSILILIKVCLQTAWQCIINSYKFMLGGGWVHARVKA